VGDTLKVAVKVQNTGKLAGDEVVELYISNLNSSVPVPLRALKGFKRIHLNAGESKIVTFNVVPDAFSIIDESNKRVIKPGKFLITAGGHQPSKNTTETETGILKKMISVI
jgi:beta-glucosidase